MKSARSVFMLLFALLTFQLCGLAAICGDPPGHDESCPTDASGQCPPNCQQCSCCSLPTFTQPTLAVGAPLDDGQRSTWIPCAEAPSSPDPAAILHVPKLLA